MKLHVSWLAANVSKEKTKFTFNMWCGTLYGERKGLCLEWKIYTGVCM